MNNIHYVYIYLDNRKPGHWEYKGMIFDYQPLYVGRGIDDRINDHLKVNSLKGESYKTRVLNKIIKDGHDPIRFKIYENITKEEAIKIEEDMIRYFGRKFYDNNGILSNIAIGEIRIPSKNQLERMKYQPKYNSKRINQLTLEGELIKTWEMMILAMRSLEITKHDIDEALKNTNKTAGGFKWEFEGTSPYIPKYSNISNNPVKPVYQYDLNGKFISSYKNSAEAARKTNSDPSAIRKCCVGKLNKSNNFQWCEEYKGEKIEPPKPNYGASIKIYLFSENFKFVNEYQNIGSALRFVGIKNRKTSTGSIQNPWKILYRGYYWITEENLNKNPILSSY